MTDRSQLDPETNITLDGLLEALPGEFNAISDVKALRATLTGMISAIQLFTVLSCVWESYGKFSSITLKTNSISEKTQVFWEFPNPLHLTTEKAFESCP